MQYTPTCSRAVKYQSCTPPKVFNIEWSAIVTGTWKFQYFCHSYFIHISKLSMNNVSDNFIRCYTYLQHWVCKCSLEVCRQVFD